MFLAIDKFVGLWVRAFRTNNLFDCQLDTLEHSSWL